MKLIPLTQGKFAMVDDEDYAFLNHFKWFALKGPHTFYAARKIVRDGKRAVLFMHRVLCPSLLPRTDHINGNGLDNVKSNLRPATPGMNKGNSFKWMPNASSKYKGIYWHKKKGSWIARIGTPPNRIVLGTFSDELEAVRAYDAAATKYYGAFARLNLP